MNEKKTKILSFVAVLLMTGAILATVPFVSGVNGDENGNITINVQDTDNNPVNGYYLELYDVLNGNKLVYSDLGFTTTLKNIPPGHYEVLVPTQEIGDKVYFSNGTLVPVKPAETSQVEFTLSYAKEQYTINGTVNSYTGETLTNATITVSDVNGDFKKQTLTNQTGYYELKIYGGNFLMEMEYSGYVIDYTYMTVSDNVTVNGTLEDTPYVWGSVLDENNEVISGEVNIILYDKNTSETLFHTSDTGAYMVSIYKGNFSMFVNAPGYNTYYVPTLVCDGSSVHMSSIPLTKALGGSLNYGMSFTNDDFNTLDVEQAWKLGPSETLNALSGSECGNLRLQVDYAFGNMNGQVNTTEKNAFLTWFGEHAVPTTSSPILEVNSTYYELGTAQTPTIEGLVGDVDSESPVFINTTFNMSAYNTITESSEIPVKLDVNYNSEMRDYSYSIELPSGYERTHLSAPSDVDVNGFVTVSVIPSSGAGTATVSFIAEKSLAGNASINVATGEYAYDNGNDTYILRDGKNISFSAEFTDPNGNEEYANYSWNFGDGSHVVYGENVVHAFAMGGEYTVTLTVKEADGEGNTTTASLTVQVDDTAPTPSINTDATDNTVNENEAIEFDASASTDIVHGSIPGKILGYLWDFGDNATSTQKVVDHSYEKWGDYTVKLTVTDAVGNTATATTPIHVTDITKPVPRFNWTDVTKNETHAYNEGSSGIVYEGDEVEFDATPSYDPDGYNEEGVISTYYWTIESGNATLYSSTQVTMSYTFITPGEYKVTLNVTDAIGNYKESSKLFQVKYGPRPRLEVKNLTLSTESPREGESLYIIANISNFGDADSNSPVVTFYVNGDPLSGDVKFYKYENGSLVETTPSIPKGEYRIVKISWTPAQETYTIKVNATDPEEPSGSSITHEKEIKVTAGPAAWKGMIPVIILVAVILAIVGLYFAYSKGIGPFGEGFGRSAKSEKKEKGRKKEKK